MEEITNVQIQEAAAKIRNPEIQEQIWKALEKKWCKTQEEYIKYLKSNRVTREQLTAPCDLGLYD